MLLDYDVLENLFGNYVIRVMSVIFEQVLWVVGAVLRYKSPLMATLTENALIVSAAADMTVRTSMMAPDLHHLHFRKLLLRFELVMVYP